LLGCITGLKFGVKICGRLIKSRWKKIVQVASATYDDTFVSDITGKNETLSESLSFAIKGKVALFPAEQKKPDDADVAVFIGKKH
jgi:hypothetical protein